MKLRHTVVIAAMGLTMGICSCSTPKNITYMQNFANDSIQAIRAQSRLKIQSDDRLSIIVSAKDPELAEVFNLAVAQYRVGYTVGNGTLTNSGQVSAFTVDANGNVRYPLIGDIKVAGLERQQAADLIEERIRQSQLLKDPIVTVEFLNATVSVLGDVVKPGEYGIDRDDMTIIQALSKAGDLQITGMRENVLVVREEKGRDIAYRVNLTDTHSLFESPAYYVQQNDIIYVEPNDVKKRQATPIGNTVLTPAFWISIASLLTTITALIIR